jgi:hypothetical protein
VRSRNAGAATAEREECMPIEDVRHRALRVSIRPIEVDVGGFFASGPSTGALTGVGANLPVFSMRWTDPDYLALFLSFQWWWALTTGFSAAQLVDHRLYKATGWTVADSGGAAVSLSKKDSISPVSRFAAGDIRIATTGALTPGTRAKDPDGLLSRGALGTTAAGATLPPGAAWRDFRIDHEGPLVLRQNEGVVLDNITAMGAAGVIRLYVDLAIVEIHKSLWGG